LLQSKKISGKNLLILIREQLNKSKKNDSSTDDTDFTKGSLLKSASICVICGLNPRFPRILLDITDDTGVLASGVDSLRFTINRVNVPPFGLIGTAYREIDVFGAATVIPEPSTGGLFIFGCLV
jgi:hypothetical protein